MHYSPEDRVLTLAGLFQAATLVRRTAMQGTAPDTDVLTCIRSLFETDPPSVEAIYGGQARLRLGLQSLRNHLEGKARAQSPEVTRYVLALTYLEKKLHKNPALLQTLTRGIDLARGQAEYFGDDLHATVIASLANTYQNTISTLRPRIMVTGSPQVLQQAEQANLIRALLLAGIRSAVAWRQCGGSRWHLLFQRRRLIQLADLCLEKLPVINTRI